ncbi:TlpA family protein disulfide reductase [Fulvivirga maritima]|uniref:TlpA family protein disulfide reductase n=1 Tax=Fulvivirga maritima TaxID=2904247 RepID=UPI001F171806|nr:TlpA disulfide reductase family protein [Fulvivirga maritima]UII25398.1 TlpA family protein disulfide reductase [Fulvivirga maritima]
MDNDFDFVFNNLSTAPYTMILDYSWHLMSISLRNESMSNDSLVMLGDIIVPELEKRENQVAKKYKGLLTPKQWKERAFNSSVREYLSYAIILENDGQHDKSAKYLKKIKPYFGYDNADYNELYANMLIRNKKINQAITYIKECLKENNATPKMISTLKREFLNEGGEESEFSGYLAAAKAGEQMDAKREEVLSAIMDEPIADFNLTNLNGDQVKMSDQKGKVIILDFWATWCAPCKKAMPGMQMALDKYKSDENVVFYFIDTQEFSSDYKERVRDFIEEKGYDFNVLFDVENEETHKKDKVFSTYAKAFNFSGIPQKLIIDQNGNLRWRSTGYSGSPSELADEISIVVEYLKEEKTN